MNKRVHTKAKDWLPFIEEWQRSGLSKKVFCEQKNIPYKKFYRWYCQLMPTPLPRPETDKAASPLANAFVPIKVIGAARGNPSETCVLRLSAQLQLHIPVTVITADFLRVLFESAGISSC